MTTKEANEVLVKSSENGDLEALKEAIAAGADVNYELGTPLRLAVEKNHVDCVRLLLKNFAFPEFFDCDNWRPLHTAAEHGHVECLKLLLRVGVDVDAVADVCLDILDRGATAWDLAMDSGHGECAYLLEAAGAEVPSRFKDGTIMCDSIRHGDTEYMRVLLAAGANVNGCVPPGYSGGTFLEYAAGQGCDDALKTLLDAGAIEGRALMYAIKNKKTKTAKILINAGADVNVSWVTGKTALMQAVDNKMVTIVKMLISNGADINARDKDNKSAFDIAHEKGDEKCIALLKAAGAEASTETKI